MVFVQKCSGSSITGPQIQISEFTWRNHDDRSIICSKSLGHELSRGQ